MSSSEFHHYNRDEFLAEFYPDPADSAAIAAGMDQLRAEQRAFRLAEMRRRLGITQVQVAARMGITQGRVSAIEHAKPGTTELRTLAAYVEALGGRGISRAEPICVSDRSLSSPARMMSKGMLSAEASACFVGAAEDISVHLDHGVSW